MPNQNKPHPGWTELTTIKKTTIKVAGIGGTTGNEVEIDVHIPIAVRILCRDCGRPLEWHQDGDDDGITVWAEKCKCEEV